MRRTARARRPRAGGRRARRARTRAARRRAEVQAQLDADRIKLATLREELRAQRRRVVRLRARLHEARRVLSARLVELYRTPEPDLVTVIMKARGFPDPLEQSTYVNAVGRQDPLIIPILP